MFKKLFDVYKVPLLISLTLAVALIALRVETSIIGLTAIILGSVLGTFLLDLDYVIYAFFLEPDTEFSRSFVAYAKHADYKNLINQIEFHKEEIKEKTLNSAFFQIVLAGMAIIVSASGQANFVRALVFSTLINSIYRLVELTIEHKSDEWFWALKNKPTKTGITMFILGLLAVFVYCVGLF